MRKISLPALDRQGWSTSRFACSAWVSRMAVATQASAISADGASSSSRSGQHPSRS
ncbi:hypothetical protein K3A88_17060 [Streptomyces geysiriensis]|uniref:hypothetical protein n=1 Tax=Streptomyces geysiriensis TaxID=68207 RepID=UPI001C7CFF5E|nr:hypothetical protein [Streptomyces geysiriensis]MBX4176574.1 hypothetical protein [Streptomyces geysiriensis]